MLRLYFRIVRQRFLFPRFYSINKQDNTSKNNTNKATKTQHHNTTKTNNDTKEKEKETEDGEKDIIATTKTLQKHNKQHRNQERVEIELDEKDLEEKFIIGNGPGVCFFLPKLTLILSHLILSSHHLIISLHLVSYWYRRATLKQN